MNPYPVEIKAIEIARTNPLEGGDELLAFFTFAGFGFVFKRFALVRRAKGTYAVLPPRTFEDKKPVRSIEIVYSGIRREIIEKAVEAYRGIGGQGAGNPGDPVQVFAKAPQPDPTL